MSSPDPSAEEVCDCVDCQNNERGCRHYGDCEAWFDQYCQGCKDLRAYEEEREFECARAQGRL